MTVGQTRRKPRKRGRTRSYFDTAVIEKRLKHVNRVLAPSGWGNFRPMNHLRLDPLLYLMIYMLGTAIPITTTLSFFTDTTDATNSPEFALYSAFLTISGFNLLASAGCVTVIAILTIAATTITFYTGLSQIRPTPRKSFETVCRWTAYFAAIGTIYAALQPIYWEISGKDPSHVAALNPSILWEAPAIFAITGYILGTINAILDIYSDSDNLIYKLILPSALLSAITIALAVSGYGPESILESITSGWNQANPKICGAHSYATSMENPLQMLSLLRSCNDTNIFIPNAAYTFGTVLIANWHAFTKLAFEYAKRSREIYRQDFLRAWD